ncbi:MAG: hypothetical protein JSR40_04950 [Proteobacteria bacterium]|nr:hypothetical protein [Pseudomonadota bacterium]
MRKKNKLKAKPKAARTLVECSPHRTTGGGYYKGLTELDAEYESPNENNAIDTLVLCHDVHKIASQPIEEPYEYEGKICHYTPDFIVDTFVPGLRLEVKSVANLLNHTASLNKYLAIARAYHQRGVSFAFLIDAQLEAQPRFDNVKLLQRYVSSTVPPEVLERALRALHHHPLTVTELQARATLGLVDVWTLIARQHICFDWSQHLDRHTTMVSLPNQPFGGLQLGDILRSTRFGDFLAEMALGRRATDKRLMADATSWRRIDNPLEPWSFVGSPRFTAPLRNLRPEECIPRSPQRRRDFAPGIRAVPPRSTDC